MALAALLGSAAAASAADQPYAPLNRPGPPLRGPAGALRAALTCTSGVAHAKRDPILLVPGTNLDPEPNYAWNYERGFAALDWPYCTVTLPFHTMGDIQIAGQYVVYALRTIARRSGRQVDVLGYSQGGMLPRWSLRFWPDTRRLVHDLVALDPSNHGTLDAQAACRAECPPAYWQQSTGSHFLVALNSRSETFADIDYTVIFSRTDEVVVPNLDASGSSSLHTGKGRIANIAVQQICPNDTSDHLAMGTYDPVAYALVLDAFTHPGTADPARISRSVCAQPLASDVDPLTFAANYSMFVASIAQASSESPETRAEPPLACYVFAVCRARAKPGTAKHGSGAGHARRPAPAFTG